MGNKNDLSSNRQISVSEGQKFAQAEGKWMRMLRLCLELEFVESSALTSSNVDTAFYKLISQIHDKVQSGFFNECLE